MKSGGFKVVLASFLPVKWGFWGYFGSEMSFLEVKLGFFAGDGVKHYRIHSHNLQVAPRLIWPAVVWLIPSRSAMRRVVVPGG